MKQRAGLGRWAGGTAEGLVKVNADGSGEGRLSVLGCSAFNSKVVESASVGISTAMRKMSSSSSGNMSSFVFIGVILRWGWIFLAGGPATVFSSLRFLFSLPLDDDNGP